MSLLDGDEKLSPPPNASTMTKVRWEIQWLRTSGTGSQSKCNRLSEGSGGVIGLICEGASYLCRASPEIFNPALALVLKLLSDKNVNTTDVCKLFLGKPMMQSCIRFFGALITRLCNDYGGG